jgi:putative MFS transporter
MSYASEVPRAITPELIVARIERLPPSKWDLKVRSIIAIATFFDGYDVVAIAFVLPALIGLWHMRPQQIGLLLSAGFAGQLIGAPGFGWLAERYGRIRILSWAILMLSVFGVGCALSTSYWMLVGMRFCQGLPQQTGPCRVPHSSGNYDKARFSPRIARQIGLRVYQ